MKNLTNTINDYLKEKEPIGDGTFRFDCHSGLECFTRCCRNINIDLYPYDIIRMKRSLGISSDDLLDKRVHILVKDNPHFPSVMLRMQDDQGKTCPFLSDRGCSIYHDRPDACRTYPVERAVSIRHLDRSSRQEYYFLTPQPLCKGHFQEREWTVKEWLQDQQVEPFNAMNDLWTEMDILFRSNPWGPEGFDDKRFKMAFMASYNVDMFRKFVFESTFLQRYAVHAEIIQEIGLDDRELLKFGFDWIKLYLFGIRSHRISLR